MTFVTGLTGSIGMGKSTTAKMFADEGVPIWDADATVHKLYSRGGAAVEPIRAIAPSAIADDAVSRPVLRDLITSDPAFIEKLNSTVHPLVRDDREAFLDEHEDEIVVLDIPLLFETGADGLCDFIVVVSVPPDVQRERVLSRGGMSAQEFDLVLSRQMPDAEKRAKADRVIVTLTMDDTRKDVRNLLRDIRQGKADAGNRT